MCTRYTATYTDYCETHALQRIATAQNTLIEQTVLFQDAVEDLKKHSNRGNSNWWNKRSGFAFYSFCLRGLSDELDAMSDAVDKATQEYVDALRTYSLTSEGIAMNRAKMDNPQLPEVIRETVVEKYDEAVKYQAGVQRTVARKKQSATKKKSAVKKPRSAKAGMAMAA